MRIIIDGNDGVGKTTLAKRLQSDLGIKSYIHLSSNDPRDFNFYMAIIKKENVIFDRSFMDEIIYSKILNRTSELTDEEDQLLHKYIEDHNIYVIICQRSIKMYDKDEDENIISNATVIDQYFKELASKYHYILWVTDTMNERDYKCLVEFLKENG